MSTDWQAMARRLADLQTGWTASWHEPAGTPLPEALADEKLLAGTEQRMQTEQLARAEQPVQTEQLAEFEAMTRREHRANFDLWHEEDKARDPEATDAAIATIKRRIDQLNQRRNDAVEQMDESLLAVLGPPHEGAERHSETPGMMLDRLSVLALKVFHTREQTVRLSATNEHRVKSQSKLLLLEEQRADLAEALALLLVQVSHGRKRFKLYRQLKMYNDPEMNPQVYGRRRG